jgi:arginyl-tRNA synthetase
VDVRQSLHFKQIFTLAYLAGFAPENCRLEHMPFGTMLGEDKKPFKTRSGDLVKLQDLLDEAETRAHQLVDEKQPALDEQEKKRIARQVGIGAVKYADLSKNRTSDYVFNWNSMLSFEGNTAPYLQYAYARIQSIFRKHEGVIEAGKPVVLTITEPSERELALKIIQFNDVADSVVQEGYPHYLCKYLYELTQSYMSFYEQCPVLKADNEAQQQSRLYLCKLTASVLQLGLGVLGIETPESM